MTQEVKRSYLEINSLKDLKEVQKPSSDYSLKLLDPVNFQLNKFFYKNVGKKHKWIDRLAWEESKWIEYVSNKNVKTYIFKKEDDLVGFFELLEHSEKKEIEIAYFGLLEEYHNKKLGPIFYYDTPPTNQNKLFQFLFFQNVLTIQKNLQGHLLF